MAEGEGAFYGRKSMSMFGTPRQALANVHIQVDFALPHNFGLEYADTDNVFRRPVMIHSAKAGSIERFFGVLVEHYAGAFPLWLAPIQVTVSPVADRHSDYARQVAEKLESVGLRVRVDASSDRLGEKIRRAMTAKHPVVMVVGDQDVKNATVGLRRFGETQEKRAVPLPEIAGQWPRKPPSHRCLVGSMEAREQDGIVSWKIWSCGGCPMIWTPRRWAVPFPDPRRSWAGGLLGAARFWADWLLTGWILWFCWRVFAPIWWASWISLDQPGLEREAARCLWRVTPRWGGFTGLK